MLILGNCYQYSQPGHVARNYTNKPTSREAKILKVDLLEQLLEEQDLLVDKEEQESNTKLGNRDL